MATCPHCYTRQAIEHPVAHAIGHLIALLRGRGTS